MPSDPTPARASRWFRANLWLHRWTSLLATLPFLVLCLTGAVLIFDEEVDSAMGWAPLASQSVRQAPDFDQAVLAAMGGADDLRIQSLGPQRWLRDGLVPVRVAPADAQRFRDGEVRYVDASTGALSRPADAADEAQTPTQFLLELHAEWLLGFAGELLGALIALLVVLSLLSGLVVYAPYVRRLAFGRIRQGGSWRLAQLDWHNFIGVLVLGWALAVSITGLLLGLSTLSLSLWQYTELRQIQTDYPAAAIEQSPPPHPVSAVLSTVRDAAPGWRPTFVTYPGSEFATPGHYLVLLEGPAGLRERLAQIAVVDARSGALEQLRPAPWYLTLINLAQPLHFGDYGGLPLKILWLISTLLTLFITGNGAALWWARRAQRHAAVTP